MTLISTITRFNPYESETVVAFFDAELDLGEGNRLTLHGLKVIKSKNDDSDYFLGVPQREHSGKYYDYYSLSPALKDSLLALAVDRMNK